MTGEFCIASIKARLMRLAICAFTSRVAYQSDDHDAFSTSRAIARAFKKRILVSHFFFDRSFPL